jgi:hypothetical protein
MKNIKFLGLGSLMLVGTLFMSNTADAKKIGGNYINSAGCLVVWTQHTFLGIGVPFTYHSETFCNDDGTPVNFG